MKLVISLALAAGLSGVAGAQQPAPPAAQQNDSSAATQARDFLNEVFKAYRDAKAMTDTVRLTMEGPDGEQTQEMKVTLSGDKEAIVAFDDSSIIAVDGKLHYVRDEIDKVFEAPFEGDLRTALRSVFGDEFPVPPQVVFRSDAPFDQKLAHLTLGFLNNADFTGIREIKGDDDVPMREVTLTTSEGKGVIQIASNTKLVRHALVELTPQGAPPEVRFKFTIEFSPKTYDALPTPIAFDAGKRKIVTDLGDMEPTPVQVGEVAPDFTLQTLSGETVKLSDLHGSMVVLDFWATWCGPCRRGLPLLQEFATWAKDSGKSIKVYAVNVWERTKDLEQRKSQITDMWKFDMPTLVDTNNKVVGRYGFNAIPATVVVGPDGKIMNVHTGFSEDMVKELKADADKAFNTTG